MAVYESGVVVTITRTYEIVLQVEANDIKEAEDLLRWKALGMKQLECDLEVDDPGSSSYYEGEETTVDAVGQIELVPEEELR